MAAASLNCASPARAGVWGTEPVLGLWGDYSSNPALLADVPDTAESHGALLLDAPTTYVGDGVKLSILPRLRLSNSRGYSSTDSDYAHLDTRAEYDTERSVYSAAAGVARDSSLYHDYLFNGATGVRRDGTTADLNWDRQLSERLEWDTDLNALRVRYGATSGTATLTDYQYASLSPTVSWVASERNKITLAASAGRYQSLDRTTQSTSYNLQLGMVRQLDPLWSLTGSAGYSRALNQDDFFAEELVFVQGAPALELVKQILKSTQNGTVFNANLVRQSSRWSFTAAASRQLAPTGLAFLTRQDTYDLKATYQASARWTLGANARWNRYQSPQPQAAGITEATWSTLDVNATWLWTEFWTVTFDASRIVEHGSHAYSVAATSGSVEFARHFSWKSFQ